MQRLLATLLMLISSVLLALLLFVQPVLSAFRSPEFFINVADTFDLYGLTTRALKNQVQGTAARSGIPVEKEEVEAIVLQILPREVFNKELKKALTTFTQWFNSNAPASKLDIRISLTEVKKNLGGAQGSGIPDELSLKDLLPRDSRDQTLAQLSEIRGYYQLSRVTAMILWGLLGLLIIFMFLLRAVSFISGLRFIGGMFMLSGLLAGAIAFALPNAIQLFLQTQDLKISPSSEQAIARIVADIFNPVRVLSVIFVVGAIAIFVVTYLLSKKRSLKQVDEAPQ